MTDQPNVPTKNQFPIIRKIGRAITGLLYLEMGIYLILGLVALLLGGINWLTDIFK